MSRAGAGAGSGRRGTGAVRGGVYAPPEPDRVLTAHSADGAPLHVEVHGPADAPAVVLAHGWTCSTAFWAAQIRELAGECRVIAYDQRGHGRTAPAAVCSTEALADDLEAVLDATLAPGERAVLAGHSMGGMTLMAAAGRPGLREHAAALLLCSTGASRLVAESRVVPLRAGRLRTGLTGRVLASSAPLGPVTPLAKKVLRYATMGPGASPDKVEACARIVHACPRRVRQAWSHVLAGLEVDSSVRELTMPTVVVAGSADRLTPPVHARRLAAALPDCRSLDVLAGVGHMTPVEAPEFITGKIRALVAAHLAAPATGATVDSEESAV
ncbi:alpha/beta fold hydrolase [Streptomyces sp. NBC_00083]|uniref:alpha/beta fold hydrolase n=1 Tax=Streptomyces sp. NBC_00083 TaxID=2975647 RepID=UPI002259FB36|nr:alpha/beta hydrolase [Streptomyces sp. NBC_00083]MCX5381933.1 alpha/beta hydrolase [Streptomyces sp. NBC_00083]